MPPLPHLPTLLLLVVLPGSTALASGDKEDCQSVEGIDIWTSPASVKSGEGVKVVAVLTEDPAEALWLTSAQGDSIPVDSISRGGPPWSLTGGVMAPVNGDYRIEVRRGGETVACRRLTGARGAEQGAVAQGWTRSVEAFFSAWIEHLFDAPVSDNLSFKSLEPVLRDPDRNFLHNHLDLNEDVRLPATPDCADLPYYLRAYFAWKVGLPISFRACDRGTSSRPPRCGRPNVDERFTRGTASVSSFTSLMRQMADTVHSGSARTGLADENTDFYPVPLERESLWPGTVYADPYGHILMIARWVPQNGAVPGMLLAVDAQPDNSVARKRFWEGNFLFAKTRGAGPGFKAFRPLLRDGARPGLPANAWLAVRAPVAAYSEQQDELSPEDFYARLAKLINPRGLAPEQAYDVMLDALVEQIETRVGAIDNGEKWLRTHRNAVIPMPSGAAIFETIGPWEDYATPSRDMRLLIALDVISRLPSQIVRYPDLYTLSGRSADAAGEAIERRHEQRIGERRFNYRRSDGSSWELTIAEVFARRDRLEMGYNPNDCVEARWGAPTDSDEYATCRRHAPVEQKSRMARYRTWFHNTQRPTR